MQSRVAVVTMVRDDAFFLTKWVQYYGGLFGRENLYVINHGHGEAVRGIASGCNVMGIPGDPHKNFDGKRWRMFNGLINGLRGYYTHVICGDVDELVVTDPASGGTLADYLFSKRAGQVLTPIGLELVHVRDRESDAIDDKILGPRRHVQHLTAYSKPCIISVPTRLSRGGHFTDFAKLETPEYLYLFHLKYCDFDIFGSAMDGRNEAVRQMELENPKDGMVGRHWFPQFRKDEETFAGFSAMHVEEDFDFTDIRAVMHDSWQSRNQGARWHFRTFTSPVLHVVPDRFFGIF